MMNYNNTGTCGVIYIPA